LRRSYRQLFIICIYGTSLNFLILLIIIIGQHFWCTYRIRNSWRIFSKIHSSQFKVIIFSLIWFLLKKNNKIKFFYIKKKPKPVQTDWFRFCFLDKNRFKPVWLGFVSVFSGFFGFDLVRFGFFGFRLIKLKPNRSVFSKF